MLNPNFTQIRISHLILFIIFFILPLRAQIAGGLSETTSTNMGGNNYISGSIFLPDGSPVNGRIPIKLQSMTKGEVLTTTDDRGKFVFSRIAPGVYIVIVEGSRDFESANQEVEVMQMRNAGPQTFSITIRLKPKANTDAKPSVINAESVKVPKKAVEFYRKAVKLAGSNEREAAIEQLKLAITEYPSYMEAFNEMGVQYMRLNELEKADEALRTALKLDSNAFEPLVNHGIVLFRLKKFDESETQLRAALKIKGDSAIAHYYLGRLLTELARYDEAEKELKRALKESGDQMNEVHRMLANMYIAKGDNKRAIKELDIYLRLVPTAPDAERLRQVISQLKTMSK